MDIANNVTNSFFFILLGFLSYKRKRTFARGSKAAEQTPFSILTLTVYVSDYSATSSAAVSSTTSVVSSVVVSSTISSTSASAATVSTTSSVSAGA